MLAFIFIPSTRAISESFVKNYGSTLANMAAKQAVDATFNHDLVRLQVILQDVITNPYAHLATIHDVENNLLVQAGDSRTRPPHSATFTSHIALRDSVAGYVTITIKTDEWSLNSAVLLTISVSTLLFVLALWSLFHSKAIVWQSPTQKYKQDKPEKEVVGTSPEVSSFEEPLHSDVFAIIHIKNLNVLKQQLNGQSFRDTMGRLEKIMSDVMALYGGHQFRLTENYYILNFQERDSRGEALFNASCTAYLILELAGIVNKVPLDLAALVSANKENVVPENLPFAGLIVEEIAGGEALINRRITFMELGTEDGRQVLSSFRQPFQNLLENQLKQLSQIL